MDDGARSTYMKKPRKRVLVVSNASPESSEDDMAPPEPPKPRTFPRPLPSPSRSFPSAEAYPPERFHSGPGSSHIPTPLTTNLHCYPRSNPSNPALSSPSSTSSPAVESTPPPSTPGLSGSTIQLNEEGTIRQDMITSAGSDRNENTPQARPRQFVRPSTQSNARRYSSSGSRPATSPTVSTPDSYMPTPPHVFRSNPMDKAIVLVTTDAENLHIVDITGAMTPAFIRERIFTKLQISDEDQAKFSIYRTEIGQFAIGDALTDEELFDLYREHGDSSGKLKLLVSHSSATVHEPGYDSIPTSTVNTIPPPVLPQASLYAPLRPNRQTRLRQGSQSSASEPHPAEVGYEASVSDDLDQHDVDTAVRDARDYPRPAIHSRALPMPTHRPSSPSGYGRRSRSPANLLSPDRSVVQSPESRAYRSDPYHIGASPVPVTGPSPQTSRFDDLHPLPPLPPSDARSSPATETAERERSHTNDGTPSSYAEHWQREREDRERERRRREQRKESGRHRDADSTESRAWTIVPGDVPSSGYKKDRPTTPQEARSNGRFPLTPPSLMGGLSSYRAGSSGSGESSSRRKLKQVPSNWAVTWKHSSNKADPKPVPTASPQSLMRHGAKSMTDMRGAFKHPPSLQPGRGSRPPPPQPPLPMITRPSTGGSCAGGPSLPSASSPGDILSAHSELGPSPDVARSALSPSNSYMRSPYGIPSATSNSYLGSPAQDPFPRPRSALGESSSAPYTQPRYMHSPQNSETSYDPISHRIPLSSGQGYGTNVSIHSYSYRDDTPRAPPPQAYGDQQSDVGTGTAVHSIRGPRTPPRSPVDGSTCGPGTNGFEPSSLPTEPPGTAFAKRGAINEDNGSHTVRADDRTWLEGFIDENAAEGTMRPPQKPRPPPDQQLPTPPPTIEMPNMSSVLSTSSGSTLTNGSQISSTSQNADDEDSDSDEGATYLWAKKPPKKSAESQQATPGQKPASTSRPPLAPLVFPSMDPNAAASSGSVDYGRSPPPGFPGPPDYIPSSIPPRTPRRTPAITQPTKKLKDRISKFDNNFDVTWAPRPPPEVMYERLEEYFPEHDLDKPVIDAPSGGTSPTATEAPAVPVQPRFKHKKSIRVVAAEHKRQMDRTSRGDNSTVAPLSRKRHTKLWGSKLEEVTTEQGKGPLSSTASDGSPGSGGGTKLAIFRWVRGELIGKGTYGRVYLALNATTGEMIAVKQVEIPRTASDKDDSRQVTVVEALKLESETLKDLDHPHIVQYLGFEETPTFLSIFLEYVPGGSIASCLRKYGRFDEEVTKSFTGQILSGLEYLHSRGILHRDLKADNILVETSGVCKISDFGISKRTDDINMAAAYTSMQGTVFWMAPEVVNSKGKGYNSKIDIWSVGCVVFEMWTGQRPWSGQEAMAVLLHLYQTKQAPPVPDGIVLSPLADDFRLQCFAADPDERPSAAELRKHTYLELQPGWSFNGFQVNGPGSR